MNISPVSVSIGEESGTNTLSLIWRWSSLWLVGLTVLEATFVQVPTRPHRCQQSENFFHYKLSVQRDGTAVQLPGTCVNWDVARPRQQSYIIYMSTHWKASGVRRAAEVNTPTDNSITKTSVSRDDAAGAVAPLVLLSTVTASKWFALYYFVKGSSAVVPIADVFLFPLSFRPANLFGVSFRKMLCGWNII